jgi:hypothetical protein
MSAQRYADEFMREAIQQVTERGMRPVKWRHCWECQRGACIVG